MTIKSILDALPGNVDIASGKGICDFCVPALPDAWIYGCKTFVMPVPPELKGEKDLLSDGAWGACETCAELIESNDRKPLVERMAQTHPVLVKFQTEVIDLFFENRTDEPRIDVRGQATMHYPENVIVAWPSE